MPVLYDSDIPCLPLWGRWPSEARSERVYAKRDCQGPLSRLRRQLSRRESQVGARLPLPLGEVAERSEDGEGIQRRSPQALSVACGDSSPGGRAKQEGCACLPLWERCLSEARTERVYKKRRPLRMQRAASALIRLGFTYRASGSGGASQRPERGWRCSWRTGWSGRWS